MTPAGDDLTSGEISRSLTRLESAMTGLTVDMKSGFNDVQNRMELMRSEFVHRTEYDERKAAVNREIILLRQEIGSVEAEVKARLVSIERAAESRRPQWTAVGAFIAAIVAIALPLITK